MGIPDLRAYILTYTHIPICTDKKRAICEDSYQHMLCHCEVMVEEMSRNWEETKIQEISIERTCEYKIDFSI